MKALKAILTLASCVMLLTALSACGGGSDDTTSQPRRLPDTGQTTCYDLAGNVISCAGTGQDGEFSIHPMSFTDNGDGTVTDNVTGLMWQKEDDDQTYNWYQAAGVQDGTFNNAPVTDACGSLTLAGHSDWRLPDEHDLMTIVDYGTYDPAIDAASFPNTNLMFFNTALSEYWTSRTTEGVATNAWNVRFSDGLVGWEGKTFSKYVRCVRGAAAPAQSFTDNGNGMVTDNNTILVWQQEDDNITRTWQKAVDYCNGLSLAGRTDWRLPDVKELHSIVDSSVPGASIASTYFPNTNVSKYWTSTTLAQGNTSAWVVSFDYGYTYIYNKTDAYYVRCVR